ncbi:polysaccharide biosynthesis tyrosine autokinase [Akkermansia sp. BIOML-A17]|uniref:polysaccharide biosynthesis tyrosine autokinase n=1 Tax=Akkermansia sp. BIOML-A17 TaxID=2584573 RepID=UPI00122FA4EB|nr:polysaccharide biosynthesis tyrosine autokinase [Akkermansia sp. BIOML-A17]KAA3293007.1 polysaccharide biosynthesis tyrosine autokinase [Akkermansia sp. BIOML-A17]
MNAPDLQNGDPIVRNIDYIQVLKNRWKEVFLVFMLVLVISLVVTLLMPPSFRATSKFQIKRPRPVMGIGTGEDVVASSNMTDNYIPMQYSVLTSSEVLKVVSKKLNLAAEWGMTDELAATNLAGMIKVYPRRATDLVDVIVSGPDPKLVQNIAKAVPEAYKQDREMRENRLVETAIKSLQDVLREQEDIVNDKMMALKKLIAENDYLPSTMYRSGDNRVMTGAMEDEDFRNSKAQLMKFEKDEQELAAYVAEIQRLPDDKLMDYVTNSDLLNAEILAADSLRKTYQEYMEKDKERETLKSQNLGPKHPKMVALQETANILKEKLSKELVGLRSSLKSKLEMVAASRMKWEKIVAQKEEDLRHHVMKMPVYEQTSREYDTALDQLKTLDARYKDEIARLRVPRESIEMYDNPLLPSAPYKPDVTLNLAVGAVAGLLLGVGLALLLEFMDTSVKTMEDVERALQVPVLGIIPKNVPILHSAGSLGPDAEAYRILRTNIEFNKKGLEEISLTFVSGSAGEGKTTTLCNLAYICAQGGYATLMIDGDLRRSKLHRYYELDNEVGLTSYLLEDYPLEDVIFQTPVENLYVMPAGPIPFDPSGALNSRKFSELLQEVKQRFDIVLVDSPPILGVSDSAVIVSEVDMTLMVVQPRKLPLKALLRQKQVIESVGGNLAGVVMNNVDITSDHQYQYYTTYYSYYSAESGASDGNADASSLKKAERSGKAKELAATQSSDNEDLY